MNWNNLKSMKCPKCAGSLSPLLICRKCGFMIGSDRFNAIVSDLYKPKKQRVPVADNGEMLNNLGYENDLPEGFGHDPEMHDL